MNYSTRRVAALLTACLSLTANVQAIPAPTPAPDPAILAKRIFTLQTVAQSVWDSELQAASSAAVVQASIQSAAEASAAPQIESDCAANKIVATDTAAWAQYSAGLYLESLLAPYPVETPINIANVLNQDVRADVTCDLQNFCDDSWSCSAVHGDAPSEPQDAARYLAFQGYITFSNFLYIWYSTAFKAAQFADLNVDGIIQTFFGAAPPDNTWKTILGILGPIAGMFSALIGTIPGGGIASGTIGGASSLLGLIASTANGGPQAMQETQWMASGALETNILNYLTDTSKTLLKVYDQYITNVSPAVWLNLMGQNGFWSSAQAYQDTTHNEAVLENTYKYITLKAINWAWNSSDAFIIYMPYGDTHKTDGTPLTQADCTNTWQSGDWKTLTVCDANNGAGMASIFQAGDAGNIQQMNTNRLHGFDNTSTIAGWTFDTPTVIRGSVASWVTGDFNYGADEALGGTDAQTNADGNYIFSPQTARNMQNYQIDPAAAGIFNIPVCRIFDVNSYPPNWGHYSACGCALPGASGFNDKTKMFTQHVGQKVKTAINIYHEPNSVEHQWSCEDIYQGPSVIETVATSIGSAITGIDLGTATD